MSLFVAGSLAHCQDHVGTVDSTEPTTSPEGEHLNKHPLAIPTNPIEMRVRIGRFRNGERCKVQYEELYVSGNRWQIPQKLKTVFNQVDDAHLESVRKQKFVIGDSTSPRVVTGSMHLYRRKDISHNAFDLVVHVPLEDYLPGVLAGELYAHWHPDTFAAQAVAARSYAIVEHLNRKNTSHFDVEDGPSSQMFLGDVSLKVAHDAVKETRNVILTWEDTVVPAYYSACCGGKAATAIDAISGSTQHKIAPLFGRSGTDVCTKLDIHKWDASRGSRTFRRRLNASAKIIRMPELDRLRSVRKIEPTAFNKHGRPTKLAIYDRKRNNIEINAKDFLRIANATVPALPSPTSTVWSSSITCEKNESDLIFKGVGLGHGVGLCQYGAQELASMNRNWEEILHWYYPSASIQSMT